MVNQAFPVCFVRAQPLRLSAKEQPVHGNLLTHRQGNDK